MSKIKIIVELKAVDKISEALAELRAVIASANGLPEWVLERASAPRLVDTGELRASGFVPRPLYHAPGALSPRAQKERGIMFDDVVSCPECGEIGEIRGTTEPDEDGLAEHHCGACGCYFVAMVPECREDEDNAGSAN